MTRTEVIDILREIHSYTTNPKKLKALDYAIAELETVYDCNDGEEIANAIEELTWYSLKNGEMQKGASEDEEAWYKATDILRITEKYIDIE